MTQSALSVSEITDFVTGLELPETHPQLQELATAGRLTATDVPAGQPTAAIDAGSLVSFAAQVSSQHRSDCLNSLLVAQLNSDKLYNRFDPTQVISWYKNYGTVMSNIGWVLQDFQFQNYQASGSTFSIDTAITSIVTSFLPAPEVAVVEATLNALSNLGSDDPWYKVWDSSSHSANGGNFQLAPASDNNGEVNSLVVKISAYAFSTTETTTRFLWTDYNSSDTQLQYAQQTATLNEDVYAQIRQAIIDKLGDRAATYIGNLSI